MEEKDSEYATQLIAGSVLPMVLKSAIELDLLELIEKAGPNGSASASELASQLPITNNPNAANMIDRILCLLSGHSILNCSLETLPDGGGVERRYSLAPVCKFLTKKEDGVSVASLSLINLDKVLVESWYHLKDAILEGGFPFNRAHGKSLFDYAAIDSRFNKVFQKAMSDQSTITMNKILESYKGFYGLKSLVDVGGGIGSSLNKIISKYPSIKGINFDLPHVVKNAPAYKGIEHIGGDMFVRVPKADAIFMKWIYHDWSDSDCKKLLKNCYESIPENGKVIIAEYVLPDIPNSEPSFLRAAQVDLIIMAITPGGKERTEKEYESLAKAAGFKQLHKVCHAFNIWIMELYK